jgi:two-component system, NarL family, nitrate/nitrite response regulator NarL
MTQSIRLAIVDDHPLLREGVARSLSETGAFEICGEGASAADAIRLAAEIRPDILLVDLSMPGGGLHALARIRDSQPDMKIVILTVSEANDDVTAALDAGAQGYVLKGVGSKTLAEILHSVAAGETYVSPALAARMLMSLKELKARASPANPLSSLTQRERQILESVANGLSNKEVAIRLDLQEKTVKHHMTRIMAKLGARNRTEAAMLLRDAATAAVSR